ncbi:MAG: hypothetical protein QM727_01635 [Niabella sp.]
MKKLSVFAMLCMVWLLINCSKSDNALAASDGAGGSTARMTIAGNYLYVVTQYKLQVYDISDPEKTVLLNGQSVGWNVETIFPYRDKLFIGSQTGMFVYDISNPKDPKLQGQVQHIRACDPVVAEDDYAYVTLRNNNVTCGGTQNELNIYDIIGTNVLTPKLIGNLGLPEPHGLGYKGNILYVCCGRNGLYIVDIEDKNNPREVKRIDTGEDFVDVIPYGDLLIAYIQGGIILYDITDSRSPQKLSAINQ